MKFLKDCDFQLMYQPEKANVVVDALSRKSVQLSVLMIEEQRLIEQFRDLNLEVNFHRDFIICGRLTITNDFVGRIRRNSWKILA